MPNPTRSISDEFLECRLHHAWTLIRNIEEIPERPGALQWNTGEIWSKCLRCGTRKFVRTNVYGARAGGGYLHPDGYGLTAETSPSKDQLRVEVSRRLLNPALTKRKTRRQLRQGQS